MYTISTKEKQKKLPQLREQSTPWFGNGVGVILTDVEPTRGLLFYESYCNAGNTMQRC